MLVASCEKENSDSNSAGATITVEASSSSAEDLAAAMAEIATMKASGSNNSNFVIEIPGVQSEDLDLSYVDLKIMDADDNIEFKFAGDVATRSSSYSIKGPEGWLTNNGKIQKKPRIKSAHFVFDADMGYGDDGLLIELEYSLGRVSAITAVCTFNSTQYAERMDYDYYGDNGFKSTYKYYENNELEYEFEYLDYTLDNWVATSGTSNEDNYLYSYTEKNNSKYIKSATGNFYPYSGEAYTWSNDNVTKIVSTSADNSSDVTTESYTYSSYENNFDIDLNSILIDSGFRIQATNHDIMMRLLGKTSNNLIKSCSRTHFNGESIAMEFTYNEAEIELPTEVAVAVTGDNSNYNYTVKITYDYN
ncbi:MAG: hypothetical protein R3Y70_04510 [Rikenellaceae bacterium]